MKNAMEKIFKCNCGNFFYKFNIKSNLLSNVVGKLGIKIRIEGSNLDNIFPCFFGKVFHEIFIEKPRKKHAKILLQ